MQKSQGFTLIEMIMVIVIMGILSVVVARVLFHGYQNFTTAQNITEADWAGFFALERLTNDIHRIRANQVTTIAATQLAFTDVSGSTVQYQLSGSQLLRNSIPLIDGVQSLSLTYFDKNGTSTATPASVRYIVISIGLSANTFTTSFTTMAALRGVI